MLNKSILTAFSLCLGLAAGAQTLDFNVSSNLNSEGTRIHVRPVNDNSLQSIAELLRSDDGKFHGEVNINPDGLYQIYSVSSNSQAMLPIYIPAGNTKCDIDLQIAGYVPNTSLTDDANKALRSYAEAITQKAISLGRDFDKLSDDAVIATVKSYISDADSISALKQLPEPVANYIKLWAYTSASDAINMVNHLSARSGRTLTVLPSEYLPDASKMLDNTMAISFPSASQTIMASLPKGTLDERISALYENYKTPVIREKVAAMLVDDYLSKFDYANNFEKGEGEISEAIKKYSLPEKYLDTFRARKATIKGTPFPANVELVDRDGNKVDFSKFRGKYVYLDLWASWCGPCCREVPFLQALEKEFEGSNVEFVSISIDSTKAPWLKKMEQLNMHGNQLWNSDELLPKSLNVRGIPHFLIYDPEGKLYLYNAPRPSSEEIKDLLKSLK